MWIRVNNYQSHQSRASSRLGPGNAEEQAGNGPLDHALCSYQTLKLTPKSVTSARPWAQYTGSHRTQSTSHTWWLSRWGSQWHPWDSAYTSRRWFLLFLISLAAGERGCSYYPRRVTGGGDLRSGPPMTYESYNPGFMLVLTVGLKPVSD